MNGIELLKKFAEENGISDSVVSKFLSKFNNPKTMDELLELPSDMLEHVSYISYLDEPLKSFIKDNMWCERYMVIDLERVLDCLYDSLYSVVLDDVDIDDVGIENLEAKDEESKSELKKLQKVAQYIIDTKFGSVVYDW